MPAREARTLTLNRAATGRESVAGPLPAGRGSMRTCTYQPSSVGGGEYAPGFSRSAYRFNCRQYPTQ